MRGPINQALLTYLQTVHHPRLARILETNQVIIGRAEIKSHIVSLQTAIQTKTGALNQLRSVAREAIQSDLLLTRLLPPLFDEPVDASINPCQRLATGFKANLQPLGNP